MFFSAALEAEKNKDEEVREEGRVQSFSRRRRTALVSCISLSDSVSFILFLFACFLFFLILSDQRAERDGRYDEDGEADDFDVVEDPELRALAGLDSVDVQPRHVNVRPHVTDKGTETGSLDGHRTDCTQERLHPHPFPSFTLPPMTAARRRRRQARRNLLCRACRRRR